MTGMFRVFLFAFNLVHTFVIEARFGFNRMTWKTFVLDRLKGAGLTTLAAQGRPGAEQHEGRDPVGMFGGRLDAETHIVTAAVSAQYPSGWFGSFRVRYFGKAPLVEDGSVESDGSTIANLALGWSDEIWRIQVDVLNVFDSDDHDIDYYYASRLRDEVAEGVVRGVAAAAMYERAEELAEAGAVLAEEVPGFKPDVIDVHDLYPDGVAVLGNARRLSPAVGPSRQDRLRQDVADCTDGVLPGVRGCECGRATGVGH